MIENGHYGSALILLPSLGRPSSDAGGTVPCLGCQVITRNPQFVIVRFAES